jgi:5,10-methylene-tetrahydrofolate dehydrogenase/methenyl tetrahydrofolate cyclohydrolase
LLTVSQQLDETGYVKKKKHRKTKAGFQATIYELTPKAYLAILLNSIDFENVLIDVSEKTAYSLIADLLSAIS